MTGIQIATAHHLRGLIRASYERLVDLLAAGDDSADTLDELYALGYGLFSTGRYEESEHVFTHLTELVPWGADYWRALGATRQQLRRYEEAVTAYSHAIDHGDFDLVARVFRAECRLLTDDADRARDDLSEVVELGGDAPEWSPWVERAQLLLERNQPADDSARIPPQA